MNTAEPNFSALAFKQIDSLTPIAALCWPHHDALHAEIGVKGNMLKESIEFIDEAQQRVEFPSF